ncbi:hypothetical protein [Sphingosinicella sp.]|uniref:hypothetical protein n=1 Tax=Sphingosinicella sp. TaxID=1917971 RepID=UPI0040380CC2
MKKPLVLAALSGLILVGAAYPGPADRDDDQSASSSEGGRTYRPCRSRRDDNCIQLYERGVRAAYARWLRDGDPGYEEAVRYAAVDDRRYGRRGPHDHDRDDERGGHRNHALDDGHHGPDADRRGHHAQDGHRGHGADHADLGDGHRGHRERHASLGTRCEDGHARPRAPRQAIRPAPRPRNYEDSGVRGM